jgi:transposase
MITRIHGIDRHKHYSTISVLNKEGVEEKLIGRCNNLSEYINTLGESDAVILESSTGTFFWADLMEQRGASVYIVNTMKFKIIKESWKKTDKEDARNLSWGLWVELVSKNHKLPLIYKPDHKIRNLRHLFAQYQLLNQQIVQLKNVIQANLNNIGIVLTDTGKDELLTPASGKNYLESLTIHEVLKMTIQMNLEMIWMAEANKKRVQQEILKEGDLLQPQVELLISIKGVSPLVALAFLSDVGDITRFSSQKKLNAYLGVVKNAKDSGGKTQNGHITKKSRHLTRWILTQSIPHIVKSSSYMQEYYVNLKAKRGVGRSRIAVMRKTIGIMRRLLLNKETYRYCDEKSYDEKLKKYRRILKKLKIAA